MTQSPVAIFDLIFFKGTIFYLFKKLLEDRCLPGQLPQPLIPSPSSSHPTVQLSPASPASQGSVPDILSTNSSAQQPLHPSTGRASGPARLLQQRKPPQDQPPRRASPSAFDAARAPPTTSRPVPAHALAYQATGARGDSHLLTSRGQVEPQRRLPWLLAPPFAHRAVVFLSFARAVTLMVSDRALCFARADISPMSRAAPHLPLFPAQRNRTVFLFLTRSTANLLSLRDAAPPGSEPPMSPAANVLDELSLLRLKKHTERTIRPCARVGDDFHPRPELHHPLGLSQLARSTVPPASSRTSYLVCYVLSLITVLAVYFAVPSPTWDTQSVLASCVSTLSYRLTYKHVTALHFPPRSDLLWG